MAMRNMSAAFVADLNTLWTKVSVGDGGVRAE
jgi:hypothetical protein